MDDFSITGGVLRFKSAPNYEAPADAGEDNTYSIMVVVTDSDDQTDEIAVTVTVTNVDEAGTLTLSTLQPVDGIQLATTLTDIDGTLSDTTWKWAKASTARGSYTVIEGATAASYTPKPADVNHYLRVTATYTDPQGAGKTAVATTANKVLVSRSTNTAPVFKDADDVEIPDGTGIEREVAENTPKGVAVGAPVAAADSEGDVLTYTLGNANDEESFSIDVATGQLRTSAELNREATGGDSYTVMVTATDPSFTTGVDSDTIRVTINVTNVNEDPKVTGPASIRVSEATTNPVNPSVYEPTIRPYTATDDEDENADVVLTLSGPDADVFSIDDEGVVTFKAVPDFEDPKDVGKDNVYNITVVATDSDAQTDEMDVTVTVTNVEEDGTVTLSLLQPRIGTALTATLTDIDGPVSDVKWQWAKSNTAGGTYDDIEGATAASYTPVIADDGAYLRATARYTDPEDSDTAMSNPTETGFMAVEIDDTNRAPEFPDQDMETDGDQTDQEREIEENADAGESIGVPVVADDPNMDSLTYSVGGTDGASFSILRNTGQLQTKASLNREVQDTHMVTVTATDPSGLSATVNVTIKVTDVPEPPVISVGGLAISGKPSVDYAEKGIDAVETYTASGPNAAMATWSLSGPDALDFTITGGVLAFTAPPPDFENPADADTDNVYQVTVEANDGTYSDTHAVTVMVTNVDEPGAVNLASQAPVVGTALTANLTDDDGEPTEMTWQWASSDAMDGTFTPIEGATSDSYIPVADDVGKHLRATVSYTDPQGSGKSDMATAANMVTAEDGAPVDPLVDKYDVNPKDGEIQRAEVFTAINDYLDGGAGAPTRADVFKLIDLYLGD